MVSSEDPYRRNLYHPSRCTRSFYSMESSVELDYLLTKDLFIGHIASGLYCKFERMRSFNETKTIDVLVVEIDGESKKAVQWVFFTSVAKRGFVEVLRGKIWIHDLEDRERGPGRGPGRWKSGAIGDGRVNRMKIFQIFGMGSQCEI